MVGISLIAIGVEGFLFRELKWVKRVLLIIGGLGCMIPGWRSDVIGLGIGIPIFLWEWKTNRLKKKDNEMKRFFLWLIKI